MQSRSCRSLSCPGLLAWATASAFSVAAHAQTEPTPTVPAAPEAARECPDPNDKDCLEQARRAQEKSRIERGGEFASPLMSGAAPLPPQGTPAPPPRIERGPLTIRRLEFSVGGDVALSSQWVLGGLLGVSNGRLERTQSEFAIDAQPGSLPTVSDTTVRARSTSAAATLTYFPQPAVFIDASLSVMQTHFDVERLVNDAALFSGGNNGRSWGVSLAAGTVWRGNGWALVPQAGLDYVDSKVDPLETSYTFVNTPDGPFPGFAVAEQRVKTLSSVLGAQLQWPTSASFGTVTPYLRTTWRERLWLDAAPVLATADGADPRLLDPDAQLSRRAVALAGGVLFQFARGVSVFADLGYARGANQLRETRFALGIKFERR